jgi:hypothetical protein
MSHKEDFTMESLNDVLRSSRSRLSRILQNFEIPPEDAQDILQDALILLLWNQCKDDNDEDPQSTLVNAVKKRCVVYWRKKRVRADLDLLNLQLDKERGSSKSADLELLDPVAEGKSALPEAFVREDSRMLLWNRTLGFFDTVSLFVPSKIAVEDLGDAIEDSYRRICRGQPSWRIYCKMASTLFWVTINSIREVVGALKGTKVRS